MLCMRYRRRRICSAPGGLYGGVDKTALCLSARERVSAWASSFMVKATWVDAMDYRTQPIVG